MQETIEWLSEYKEVLDNVREKLKVLKVSEGINFENAQAHLFSKLLLTMYEIYTLMENGYPQGAHALARQTIESLVILDYLNKNRNDESLIQRFFCNVYVAELKMNKTKKQFAKVSTEEEDKRLDEIAQDYPEYAKGRELYDYWWVEKDCNFKKLAEMTDFKKNFTYTVMSNYVHASSYSAFISCDNSVVDIRNATEKTYIGIEFAAAISMLYMLMAMDVFSRSINVDLETEKNQAKNVIEKIEDN